MTEERELLLSFIKSLCIADHMGDVMVDIDSVFTQIGLLDLIGKSPHDIRTLLDERGITSLHLLPPKV